MFVLFSCPVKLCHINCRNCSCEQRKATYDYMHVSVSHSSCPNFRKFSVHVNWPWLGRPLTTMQCVMYFGFVDDVICVHNRPRKCNASRAIYTQVTHQHAAVGLKSGVYGCIVITVAVTTF